MTLGVKHFERVDVTDLDTDATGDRVHIDLGRFRLVGATQVRDEPAIDENPNVVVTRDAEALAAR